MTTTSGMVGGGFYDAHSSFQAAVADEGAGLLAAAVAAVALPADGCFLVADYGCAEGKNSIATVGRALDRLSVRADLELMVLHNDLPSNDFSRLIANLELPGSYLARRPQTRVLLAPRSFFERVTATASVDLGTCSSAAHWLSRQPEGLDIPTNLYRSDAPPAELATILAQAASDWLAFLAARAEEMRPGGVLLVQMLGADGRTDPVRVSAAGLLKLMNECLIDMVRTGDIPADVYACFCFPVVPRTIEEATAPIRGVLAEEFELLHTGLTPVASPYEQALERTGDVAAFARAYVAFTRAFSESTLTSALFAHGSGDPKLLADKFYGLMQATLAAAPRAFPFDDLTLSVLVRRR